MRKRREQLLAAATDYFLEHGIAGVSLRPLGSAIGSSARLLIFHFKSKEALIAASLDELERRLQASFETMMHSHQLRRDTTQFEALWLWATQPRNLRCLRLAYEVQILSMRDTAMANELRPMTTRWMRLVLDMLPEGEEDPAIRSMFTAFFDGLVLDLLSTGDRRRTSEALHAFSRLTTALLEERARLPQSKAS